MDTSTGNVGNSIVARDNSGNFSANVITASAFNGGSFSGSSLSVSGSISAGSLSVSGNLSGTADSSGINFRLIPPTVLHIKFYWFLVILKVHISLVVLIMELLGTLQ